MVGVFDGGDSLPPQGNEADSFSLYPYVYMRVIGGVVDGTYLIPCASLSSAQGVYDKDTISFPLASRLILNLNTMTVEQYEIN